MALGLPERHGNRPVPSQRFHGRDVRASHTQATSKGMGLVMPPEAVNVPRAQQAACTISANGHTHSANTPLAVKLYKRHRFPAQIISHSVWSYHPSSPSYRDVEELMAVCGVMLRYEAVRYGAGSLAKPLQTVLSNYPAG
jgi:hypothetical protein